MGFRDLLHLLGSYTKYSSGKKLNTLIEKTVSLLQERGVDFDTIAVSGVSGLLVGAPLAAAMGKDLMVVRKPFDKPSRFDVGLPIALGAGCNQKILLVDDVVESGVTLERMIKAIKAFCPNPTFVGLFLYGGKCSVPYKIRCKNDELIDVIRIGQNAGCNEQETTLILEMSFLEKINGWSRKLFGISD